MVKSYTCIIIAYVTAFLAAFIYIHYDQSGQSLLTHTFYADVIATIIIFIFSLLFRNASFYDPYWSVAPFIICLFWVSMNRSGDSWRSAFLLSAFFIWGIRLTLNWVKGWKGLQHEDWRYGKLKEQSGKLYPLINFSGIHLFPTAIIFLGMLPAYYSIIYAETGTNYLDMLALIICIAASIIEFYADEQQRSFRLNRKDEKEFCQTGLWKYSRHPNYFGEVLFWWGIYVFILAANPAYWWTIIGALAMTMMFVFISIPMMEKHLLEKRPSYSEYQKRVSALFPLFWK
ncbi:MAG: DUF1295 domain-containing protein [Chitinophagales bacterium]